MKKNWIIGITFGVITAVTLLVVVLLNMDTNSKYDDYKGYSNQLNVVDWTVSEDTAKSFADANCDKLATGEMPAIKFRSENHVKASAAVIAAYCPNSFFNFLAGVIDKHPEYKRTALYINEEIHVDDSSTNR